MSNKFNQKTNRDCSCAHCHCSCFFYLIYCLFLDSQSQNCCTTLVLQAHSSVPIILLHPKEIKINFMCLLSDYVGCKLNVPFVLSVVTVINMVAFYSVFGIKGRNAHYGVSIVWSFRWPFVQCQRFLLIGWACRKILSFIDVSGQYHIFSILNFPTSIHFIIKYMNVSCISGDCYL